jgi:hypothetical protein
MLTRHFGRYFCITKLRAHEYVALQGVAKMEDKVHGNEVTRAEDGRGPKSGLGSMR